MTVRVVDTYASSELPDDIRGATWTLATRRVRRLLNDVSMPPFVVAVELLARLGAVDPTRVALFTVSAWDSADIPPDDFEAAEARATATGQDGLYELVQRAQSTPSEWLRYLCNVSLSQIAITTGITGPNAHLVGTGEALRHALALASAVLEQDAATHALVVAFDASPADGATHSRAAGLTLTFDHLEESGRPRLDVPSSSVAFDSALVLADDYVAAARRSIHVG